jgi:hypothetical protein
VRSTAQKMGMTLPGESQPAAAAAGARPQPLPPAALDFFRGELAHREGQLQSELSSVREAHRCGLQVLHDMRKSLALKCCCCCCCCLCCCMCCCRAQKFRLDRFYCCCKCGGGNYV